MHKIKPLYMIPGSQELNGGFLNNRFFIKLYQDENGKTNYDLQSRAPKYFWTMFKYAPRPIMKIEFCALSEFSEFYLEKMFFFKLGVGKRWGLFTYLMV